MTAKKRSTPLEWAMLGIATVVLLCIACGVIGVLVPPTSTESVSSDAVPTPAIATQEGEMIATVPPVATIAPVDTALPTETPIPTPLPQPITLSGVGQYVSESFALPAPASRVVATHDGQRNFVVKAIPVQGYDELLVNVIGSYGGASLLTGDGQYAVEIDADGNWALTIEPLPISADQQTWQGRGDWVTDLFAPTQTGNQSYAFSHDGQRNFVVRLVCEGERPDLLQNTIGPAQGAAMVRFPAGLCLWEVKADGNWTITPN